MWNGGEACVLYESGGQRKWLMHVCLLCDEVCGAVGCM